MNEEWADWDFDNMWWYTYEKVIAVAYPCEKCFPNKDQVAGITFFPSTAVDASRTRTIIFFVKIGVKEF